jgi:hypothetical protein
MKKYTQEERNHWLSIYAPTIEHDSAKVASNSPDSCQLRFFNKNDYKVIVGSGLDDCVNKAMTFLDIQKEIEDSYSKYFTVRVGKLIGIAGVDYVDVPVRITFDSNIYDIREAYHQNCKSLSVCLHKPKAHENYIFAFDSKGVADKDAHAIIYNSGAELLTDVSTLSSVVYNLSAFIMLFDYTLFFSEESVPDYIIEYLPSLNNVDSASQKFAIGEHLFT